MVLKKGCWLPPVGAFINFLDAKKEKIINFKTAAIQ